MAIQLITKKKITKFDTESPQLKQLQETKRRHKLEELEAEKESIELDIINDFGEEVLEEFKSKLYSRTAEQIGESLVERPGVQIREE